MTHLHRNMSVKQLWCCETGRLVKCQLVSERMDSFFFFFSDGLVEFMWRKGICCHRPELCWGSAAAFSLILPLRPKFLLPLHLFQTFFSRYGLNIFFLILSWSLSVNFLLDNACGLFCEFSLKKKKQYRCQADCKSFAGSLVGKHGMVAVLHLYRVLIDLRRVSFVIFGGLSLFIAVAKKGASLICRHLLIPLF